MPQIWQMKKAPLFRTHETEVFVTQETFNKILSLLIRDLYSKNGDRRTLQVRKNKKVIDNFVLPEIRVIILENS